MAIEFHCPYCTAAIRVPDTAAGKRGTCPKCATKLLVPDVSIPDVVKQPAPESAVVQTEVAPAINSPAPTPDTVVGSGPGVVPTIQTKTRSRRRKRRKAGKRRRSSGLWVIIPLALVAVLVAALLFVFYRPPEKLEGTLAGKRIKAVNITPATLTAADVDSSAEDFIKAVESLKSDPLVLTSELVRTEIRGGDNAIDIIIAMTATAEFVAVDVNDPVLQQFAESNDLAFGTRRLKRLRQAATQLVSELSRDGDRVLSNPSSLRNAVALNVLRDGLGFVVEGAAGTVLCPCVYESGDQIWFAVPSGTTSFIMHGRKIDEHGKLFPGRYEVTVSGTTAEDNVTTEDAEATTADEEKSSEMPADADASEMNETEATDAATKMDGDTNPNQ